MNTNMKDAVKQVVDATYCDAEEFFFTNDDPSLTNRNEFMECLDGTVLYYLIVISNNGNKKKIEKEIEQLWQEHKEQEPEEILVRGIVCKQCKFELPEMTMEEHLDKENPKNKCMCADH